MKKQQDIFKVQKIFLKIPAMSRVSFHDYLPKIFSSLSSFLNRVHPCFMIFFPLHITLLQGKTTYDNFGGELEQLSDSLDLTLIYGFTTFATVYFIIFQTRLEKIFKYMNDNMRTQSAPGLTYVTSTESTRLAKLYTIIWLLSCFTGVIIWALYPALTMQRVHPLSCWYPFDEKKPFVYEVIYIIQFMGQLQVANVYGNGSAMYISFIILICGQYDILFCSMKNIIDTAEIFAGADVEKLLKFYSPDMKNEEVKQFYVSKEVKASLKYLKGLQRHTKNGAHIISGLREAIKDCVQHHQFILKVARMVENFYTFYSLAKTLQITFQLCLLAFVTVKTTSSTFRLVTLGGYLVLTIIELLMFTYCGELVKVQSLKVGDALLRSPVYKYTSELKWDVWIILQNAMQPVAFTGGKFFPMNIDRLFVVITSAFSYLTLLQTFDKK